MKNSMEDAFNAQDLREDLRVKSLRTKEKRLKIIVGIIIIIYVGVIVISLLK